MESGLAFTVHGQAIPLEKSMVCFRANQGYPVRVIQTCLDLLGPCLRRVTLRVALPLVWVVSRALGQGAETRPNVVLIVLDDAGFADLGAYGSEIHTPHMDRLAAGGVRYNNFHTTALCSPSRACLLTGRNHHTVGMRTITNYASEAENNRGKITDRAATLPEVLRLHGYNTLAVGKWHLAPMWETSAAGPYDNWPLGRGFERYYGFLDGGVSHYFPELVQDNHWIDAPKRPGYHLTEDLVDHAIGYVRDQQSLVPERPFFLYLAFGAPHAPHHAPKPYIDRYKGLYDRGWDHIREARLARMKQLGVVPASTGLAPRNSGVKAWDSLSADERRLYARFQEAYAGFLEHTDHHIGRFLDYLGAIGKLENTLVVLLSDNGASAEGGPNGTFDILRGVNGVPSSVADNLRHFDELGGPAVESHYPAGWAQAGNTPFQWYKQTVHPGGVRDPLIFHWPAGIKERGAIRSQFHHAIDVMPTLLDLLKLEAPTTYKGIPQLPVAGVSMAYTFRNAQAPTRHPTQYFEMLGHRGIHHEGWTAVTRHLPGTPFEQDTWELYHADEDYAQVTNLAARFPKRLRELQALWTAEANRYGVLPLDDRTNALRWQSKPGDPKNRDRFVYYPGMQHLTAAAAPDTRDRSYTITATVARVDKAVDGVLLAFGGVASGYVLYIKDNHLIHEYNDVGTIYRLVSSEELPVGRATLQFEFRKTGSLKGLGVLKVNGVEVGQAELPHTLPTMISFEGLDVGRDGASPVGKGYTGEFPFRGILEQVVVELKQDR